MAFSSTRMQMAAAGGLPSVPQGLIVFYEGASTPSGWTSFTSADDKMIIGAGSTYAANDTANPSVSSSPNTTSTGLHNGTTFNTVMQDGSFTYGTADDGSHFHVVTLSGTANPPRYRYKLIKASSEYNVLPTDAVLLGVDSISGFTNTTTANTFLAGGSTVGSLAEDKITPVISTRGSHNHLGGSANTQYSGSGTVVLGAGNHGNSDHSTTISANYSNLKHIIVSLWVAASESAVSMNGIAMWEGATAPEGWRLCDGSNGSPDFRDLFIYGGTTGNHGTKPGNQNNSVTFSGSLSTFSNTHTHAGSPIMVGVSKTLSHISASASHSHTYSQSVTHLPDYYSLTFIQKV